MVLKTVAFIENNNEELEDDITESYEVPQEMLDVKVRKNNWTVC